jgi:hypothetical protein
MAATSARPSEPLVQVSCKRLSPDYRRVHVRRLFNRLNDWIVMPVWNHQHKRWRNAGWRHLPDRRLYGELGLVNLLQLIPSMENYYRQKGLSSCPNRGGSGLSSASTPSRSLGLRRLVAVRTLSLKRLIERSVGSAYRLRPPALCQSPSAPDLVAQELKAPGDVDDPRLVRVKPET